MRRLCLHLGNLPQQILLLRVPLLLFRGLALFMLFLCLRLSFAWRDSSESQLLLPLIVGHSGTTPRSLLYFLFFFATAPMFPVDAAQ